MTRPWALPRRPDRQDARDAAYLLLGLVLGLGWFGLVAALYVSGAFAQFAPVAIVLILVAQVLLRPIGTVERTLVRRLLREPVDEPGPLDTRPTAPATRLRPVVVAWRRTLAAVRDAHSWRVLVWTGVRFVTGPLGALVVLLLVASPLLLASPVVALAALLDDDVAAAVPGAGGFVVGPLVLVVVGPLLLRALRWTADLHRRLAVPLLGPGAVEQARAALARAARAEERVRVDQELHDSIGHMLSMIVVQAGAGAHVFDRDPDFARRALTTIEDRGRAALGELDRIIADLRDGPRGVPAPLPGPQDVPALLAGAADAGLRVRSRVELGPMSPAVGRAVYRVLQEALTNAARHAPGAEVSVELALDDVAVALAVDNPVPEPEPSGGHRSVPRPSDRGTGGHGLPSIRDRAALLGGRATVGRSDDGAFAVRVLIPLGATLPAGTLADCDLTPVCACLGCAIRRTVLA